MSNTVAPPISTSSTDVVMSNKAAPRITAGSTDNDDEQPPQQTSRLDPRSVKAIGVACRTCGTSINWDVAFCNECGETFPFQPQIKAHPQNGPVPTAREAESSYQQLEAAFRAAGAASAEQSRHHQKKLKKRRDREREKENKYKGTIVKPHTFSSYGIKTQQSDGAAAGGGAAKGGGRVVAAPPPHSSSSTAAGATAPRQRRRRKRRRESSYDQSRQRLLKKEPTLLQKATVLNPGAAGHRNSDSDDSTDDTPTLTGPPNLNCHLTDVLVTLSKIERAEGNLLPAGSYERAALSLARHPQRVSNAQDLVSVRAVDTAAQSKIEEILSADVRRQLGGGKDLLTTAAAMVTRMKNKGQASRDPRAAAAKQRLVALLEEEQEREREREAFWREKNTQARSEHEKKELLQIFEEERTQGANGILSLLPHVIGRERTLGMVTSMTMEHQQQNHQQGRQTQFIIPQRRMTPFSDSGWLGGDSEGGVRDDRSALPETGDESDEGNKDREEQLLPNIGGSHYDVNGSEEAEDTEEGGGDSYRRRKRAASSTIVTQNDAHLPSLMPFAQHVLDTEDEMRARAQMPGYKRNNTHVDISQQERKRILDLEKQQQQQQQWEEDQQWMDGEGREGEEYIDEETINPRQLRYLKEQATKKIAQDAQHQRQKKQMRRRPRQLPVQVGNGEVMMLNVLDDGWQDNVPKVVPNMKLKNLSKTMVDLSGGLLSEPAPPVSTGLFWGPSLSVMSPTGGDESGGGSGVGANSYEGRNNGYGSQHLVGGGAFWGSIGASSIIVEDGEEERRMRERAEERARSLNIVDVSDSEEEDTEEEKGNGKDTSDHGGGILLSHDRSWQKRRKEYAARQRKDVKRKRKFTPYICARMKTKAQVRRDPIKSIDATDRAPRVGGIGTLKNSNSEQTEDHRTPMLTSGCRLPGSINQGRGAFAIVTIISAGGGGGGNVNNNNNNTGHNTAPTKKRGDVVVHGYLPGTGAEVSLDLSRDEVQFLLGGPKKTQNDNLVTTRSFLQSSRRNTGRSTGRSTARSKTTAMPVLTEVHESKNDGGDADGATLLPMTEFFDASEVQSYGASLRYMVRFQVVYT